MRNRIEKLKTKKITGEKHVVEYSNSNERVRVREHVFKWIDNTIRAHLLSHYFAIKRVNRHYIGVASV